MAQRVFVWAAHPRAGSLSEGLAEAYAGGAQQAGAEVRVLKLSEFKVLTRILFPAVLPHLMTGIRLAIGVAWLVIVAAEMLTGGTGLGFWVWDEWNNLNVEHILIAIIIVGLVGLALEQLLLLLAKRFDYAS